jgi:endonuclease/exonuclease/phosphatase family metal-dependent hydrolase
MKGLYYSAFTGRPVLPAMMFDQGLAIFSRYPIKSSSRKIFESQSVWDRAFVNRACLHAELDCGDGKTVNVFTCHTAPSLGDMVKRTKLAALIQEKVPTAHLQAMEMAVFIKDTIEGTKQQQQQQLNVAMGDFNVVAGGEDYEVFVKLFSEDKALNLKDITKKTRKKKGAYEWDHTFSLVDEEGKPTETLLTSPGLLGSPQALDFIFIDGKIVDESKVVPFAVTGEKFQQVSDHSGVQATVSWG